MRMARSKLIASLIACLLVCGGGGCALLSATNPYLVVFEGEAPLDVRLDGHAVALERNVFTFHHNGFRRRLSYAYRDGRRYEVALSPEWGEDTPILKVERDRVSGTPASRIIDMETSH
jgi:hypothetical protein